MLAVADHRTIRSTAPTRPITPTRPTATTRSIATHVPAASRRAPDYARRRAVAGVLVALVALVAAFAALAAVEALADLGGRPAAASEIGPAPIARIHVVEPGDTLWSIAGEHRGEVDHGAYVDALIGLNGGTEIQLGQAVRLP